MSEVLQLLALYPTLAVISALVLGLLVGSFLNVVIYRLPKMLERDWRAQCTELLAQPVAEGQGTHQELTENNRDKRFDLVYPGSTCPHCGHKIRAWENIPVISYLWLRGRCAACQGKISLRYPLVELVTGMLSAFVVFYFGANATGLLVLFLTWALIALTMIDVDTQLLPDNITLPLLWLGLMANAFGTFVPLEDALWGAVVGYLSLWSIYWAFKFSTGKEGMGFGDFKLLAALGAWMGWQMLPLIVLMSSFVGAAIGIGMILLRGRDRNIPIPFGPYLAIAGWLTLFWGDWLLTQYLQFAAPVS